MGEVGGGAVMLLPLASVFGIGWFRPFAAVRQSFEMPLCGPSKRSFVHLAAFPGDECPVSGQSCPCRKVGFGASYNVQRLADYSTDL